METLRFRSDAPLRKRLWVADAMSHPAKGHCGMWQECILRYSKEGDTILDPMAGVGTSLLAALLGRNVICVELEQHFVDPMRRSWEKMRQHPMLGYPMGEATIIQGDARDLSWLWPVDFPFLEQNPDVAVDVVVTSPPYEGSIQGDTSEATRKRIAEGKYHGMRPDVFVNPGNVAGSRYGDGYTRPAAIVTSPPYESLPSIPTSPNRLATAKYAGVPYKDERADHEAMRNPGTGRYDPAHYDNIGNLQGPAYWEAMTVVYQECYRVLKPGGIMALVLGNFVRKGLIVDLVSATIDLCKQQGFQEIDHWQRVKWSLSFWRILQARKGGPVIDREDVVALRKPYPGSGSQDFLMEKGISPLEASPPVQWGFTSARLTKDPSQQLPLSLPKEE